MSEEQKNQIINSNNVYHKNDMLHDMLNVYEKISKIRSKLQNIDKPTKSKNENQLVNVEDIQNNCTEMAQHVNKLLIEVKHHFTSEVINGTMHPTHEKKVECDFENYCKVILLEEEEKNEETLDLLESNHDQYVTDEYTEYVE